jgi:hypothetical protein
MLKPDRIKALPRFELTRIDSEDEGRTYKTPDGSFSSVTAILQATSDQTGLQQWRESVGEERANSIRDIAAFRGTKLHEAVEQYLLTGQEPPFSFLVTPYWKSIRPFVQTVEHTVILEAPVWHSDGYAGTLDCIAYLPEDDGQPTLLDWKTSLRPCKPDKLYNYSLQLAAYRQAANHVYRPQGLCIDKASVIVSIADEKYQRHDLDKEALDQLYRHFLARLRRFTYR